MTPEEAMRSKFAVNMPDSDRPTLKLLLDAIKATETWRCVAKVRDLATFIPGSHLSDSQNAETRGEIRAIVNRLDTLANDILITGGLEAEE